MIVTYLPETYSDLAEIWDFVAIRVGERSALRLTDLITALADVLTLFPHRHEAIPLTPEDKRVIRRLEVMGKYLIIYRVDDARAQVVILGVFATQRDPAGLAEILARS